MARSRELNGRETVERQPWNTFASADAIRHFALGTCDLNPLWIDPAYGAPHERLSAPPAFLISSLYPVLHGAPPPPPMASLITELGYDWRAPILEGDRLTGLTRQIGVRDGRWGNGRRFVRIVAETTYRNQRDEVVALATATLMWIELGTQGTRAPEIHRYAPAEIEAHTAFMRAERRRGADLFEPAEVQVGVELPEIVRAPLSLADLICWQAAAGPAHRASAAGAVDAASGTTLSHPLTGWPVRPSIQHEDLHLTRMRGMPLPFDNGAMRFAWVAPLITNWMGDRGVLERLHLRFHAPLLYGDLARYGATIATRVDTEAGVRVRLRIQGVNQLGGATTAGEADVLLPPASFKRDEAQATPARAGATPRARRGAAASVVALVEAQAQRTPLAPALRAGEVELSYAELDRSANRLAHRLGRAGLGRGARVALLAERTPRAVVAALAIAKAGATRLCFDAAYSGDLRAALTTVGASAVLTDVEPRPALPAQWRILSLAGASSELESDAPPATRPEGDDLAYVMFTSGTVNGAKAVAVSHASLGLAIASVGRALGIEAGDCYLHSASFAFSAAERQLWLPLCSGATLVLATSAERADPLRLLQTMQRQAVSVWDTVPTWWRWCMDRLEALPPEMRRSLSLERLRLLLVTGEPLAWELPRRWRRALRSGARIVNLYSQTETAGTTCLFPIDTLEVAETELVPLGKPIDGGTMHLLDDRLVPVGTGEVGEICIGGDRLATGYLGPAELDAARFVADPFRAEEGARLFRTGDLGRLGADGNLEYVGRADDRLKLRGLRIEPAQVEGALTSQAGVREAAVRVQGGTRLVAYLVAHGQAPTIDSLRAALAARLPPYMIPSVWIWMDGLPRTASGKLDRRALPPPTQEPRAATQPFLVPADELERELAAAWADVLGLEVIGVEDDFFAHGGDSLLAVAAVIESEKRLRRELSLDWLYDASTVRAFADRLRFPPVSREAPCLFPLYEGSGSAAVFFAAGGGGYLFAFRRLAERLGPEVSSYGLQLPGLDGDLEPSDRVEAIAAEFVRQIRLVQPRGPYHLVGYSFGGLVVYEMARQLAAAGAVVGLLCLLDTPSPLWFRPKPLRQRLRVHAARLAGLGFAGGRRYLLDLVQRRLRRWRLSSPAPAPLGEDASPTQRRRHRVQTAKVRAARLYARPPYDGRLWLFRAGEEEWMLLVDLDPTYGWDSLCAGGIRTRQLVAPHGALLEEPHVEELVTALRSALDEVGATIPGASCDSTGARGHAAAAG